MKPWIIFIECKAAARHHAVAAARWRDPVESDPPVVLVREE